MFQMPMSVNGPSTSLKCLAKYRPRWQSALANPLTQDYLMALVASSIMLIPPISLTSSVGERGQAKISSDSKRGHRQFLSREDSHGSPTCCFHLGKHYQCGTQCPYSLCCHRGGSGCSRRAPDIICGLIVVLDLIRYRADHSSICII